MNTTSLRTIISVYLFLLLTVAVLLIDFVVVATHQKADVRNKSRLHQALVQQIQQDTSPGSATGAVLPRSWQQDMSPLFQTARIQAGAVLSADGTLLSASASLSEEWLHTLRRYAGRARRNKKEVSALTGRTWGVFLPRPRYLVLASPVLRNDQAATVVTTAFDLNTFYAVQRRQQGIILVNALINIVVLTALGTFLLNRAAIRPIRRLARQAEAYRDEDDFDFYLHREKNEFQQLSGALNRMFQRITEDKEKLQHSLDGLEKAHQEIRDRQNELIKAEKLASVGRLSAGLAHEIGNPLGIVLGYLDMLDQSDLAAEDKKDFLARCRGEVNRINVVIRELLDFARSSGNASPAPVAVHALIKEAVSMLEAQPLAREVRIDCFLNADKDTVMAVSDQLRQVLVNLIFNAVDAVTTTLPSGRGHIEIQTHTEETETDFEKGPSLIITITDNGPGIPETDIDNIFDPFFTTKEPGKGTGLGLSVCYMIVDGLDGRIQVSSLVDQGTSFTVRLPLSDSATTNEGETGL
ncbi:MAG: ATP-binding protein [Desulfosudaceae bacterium]